MLTLEIYKEIPIHDSDVLTSITKAKDRFFINDSKGKRIIEYNEGWEEIASYETHRNYDGLCYSEEYHCFYAVAYENCNKVFRLNECMEEEDVYEIDSNEELCFTNIDCFNEELFIVSESCIIKVNVNHVAHSKRWYKSDCCIAGVTKDNCNIIVAMKESNSLYVYDDEKEHIMTCCLPCEYQIQDLIIDDQCVYILVTCGCENIILLCNLCELHEHKDCRDHCADIMESIALIETSISHILNAEGEKLQKIIATCDDPEELLRFNESVTRTITKITHLEIVLHSKLEAVRCSCEQEECCE